MRSLMKVLAAGSLLSIAPAFTAPAAGAPNPNANLGDTAYCKVDQATNYPNEPLGNCIHIVGHFDRGNTTGAIPGVCQFFESDDPEDFYVAYSSIADCVHDGASVFLG